MSVFAGPVQKQRVYPLIEKGEYVFTLLDLTFEAGGAYGDALLWKWMIAPKDDPTNYIARGDGNEEVIHEYTSPDVVIGSKPHEWIAALTGIVLEDEQEPPESDELVGRRMEAYLAHIAPKQGPNAGKLKQRISQGTAKQFRLPGPKTTRNGGAKAVPTQVSADPSDEEIERATVVSKLQRQVARLMKLDERMGADAQAAMAASDLENAEIVGIQALLDQVTEMVNKALDG